MPFLVIGADIYLSAPLWNGYGFTCMHTAGWRPSDGEELSRDELWLNALLGDVLLRKAYAFFGHLLSL